MNNFLKKYWLKIFNKQIYDELKVSERIENDKKNFQNNFEKQINFIHKKIETNKSLNFLHSGHTADIVNVLPSIKELSKNHECNLYIKQLLSLRSSKRINGATRH